MPADHELSVFFLACFLVLLFAFPFLWFFFLPNRLHPRIQPSMILAFPSYLLLILDTGIVLVCIIIEDLQSCHIGRKDLVWFGILAWAWHGQSSLLGLRSPMDIMGLFLRDSWIAAGPFLMIYLISGGRGIGFSDVHLLWVLGFWLGWKGAIAVMWGGCLISLILFFMLPARRKLSVRQIPLGPGIACAAAVGGWILEGLPLWMILSSVMKGGGCI